MIGCSCPVSRSQAGAGHFVLSYSGNKIAIALRIIKNNITYNVKDYTEIHWGAQGRHQMAELAETWLQHRCEYPDPFWYKGVYRRTSGTPGTKSRIPARNWNMKSGRWSRCGTIRMTRALRMWTWQMMQCRAMTAFRDGSQKRRLPPLSPLRRGTGAWSGRTARLSSGDGQNHLWFPGMLLTNVHASTGCFAGLGETNTQAVCTQRKDIVARIAFLQTAWHCWLPSKAVRAGQRNCRLKSSWTNSTKADTPKSKSGKGRGRYRHQFPSVEELRKKRNPMPKSKIR